MSAAETSAALATDAALVASEVSSLAFLLSSVAESLEGKINIFYKTAERLFSC